MQWRVYYNYQALYYRIDIILREKSTNNDERECSNGSTASTRILGPIPILHRRHHVVTIIIHTYMRKHALIAVVASSQRVQCSHAITQKTGKSHPKRKRINERIKIPQTFRRKLITKVMRKRAITLKKLKLKSQLDARTRSDKSAVWWYLWAHQRHAHCGSGIRSVDVDDGKNGTAHTRTRMQLRDSK